MEENNGAQVNNNLNKKMSSTGLASFVISLIGLVVAGLPCGIVAIITGIVGLVTFKPEEQKGKWAAIAGLVIGVIDVICMIIYFVGMASGLAQ